MQAAENWKRGQSKVEFVSGEKQTSEFTLPPFNGVCGCGAKAQEPYRTCYSCGMKNAKEMGGLAFGRAGAGEKELENQGLATHLVMSWWDRLTEIVTGRYEQAKPLMSKCKEHVIANKEWYAGATAAIIAVGGVLCYIFSGEKPEVEGNSGSSMVGEGRIRRCVLSQRGLVNVSVVVVGSKIPVGVRSLILITTPSTRGRLMTSSWPNFMLLKSRNIATLR